METRSQVLAILFCCVGFSSTVCFLLVVLFLPLGYIMKLICPECSQTSVSWVPQEWLGAAGKLRAWISGNKDPFPQSCGEILALFPGEFSHPSQHLLLPAWVLTREWGRNGGLGAVWALQGKIQALGSILSLAVGCFLGVLHVLFDFSLCPLLACAKVPCHYRCPTPPPHFRAVHTVSVPVLSLFVWMYCSV